MQKRLQAMLILLFYNARSTHVGHTYLVKSVRQTSDNLIYFIKLERVQMMSDILICSRTSKKFERPIYITMRIISQKKRVRMPYIWTS